MVSSFSVHRDRAEAIRRGHEGFEFFGYALNALVAQDCMPGRTNLWGEYLAQRGNRTEAVIDAARSRAAPIRRASARPDDMRKHLETFQDSGVDQVIFLQQAGRNRHDHICESLELFAAEVMPDFKADAVAREARKAAELAPYVAAALKRKTWMKPLADAPTSPIRCAPPRQGPDRRLPRLTTARFPERFPEPGPRGTAIGHGRARQMTTVRT